MRNYFIIACFLCISPYLLATHNRAGEITYEQIGPLTIRATITTYTDANSISADRDSLELFWGDGTSTLVVRSNGNGTGELLENDLKLNLYIAEHTYPGRATYKLSFTDPNRVENIQNVNFPNSVDVRFYVETTFTFTNTQFQGFNSSVILLQPPIDFACVNQRFIHNPNAYDPDGDSISFELVVPLESEGMEVPKYELPHEAAMPGPDNTISLDPVSGEFVWDSPKVPGEYNIAIKINEYRNGILLNSVIRDMQIFVDQCTSQPPAIEVVEELCVTAGTRIDIPVHVSDPDENNRVRVEATGGPFLLQNSPAILTGTGEYADPVLEERFIWETNCDHISDNYYQVVFRAEDNSRSNSSGIATLKTLRIKVIGPAPEITGGETTGDSIIIKWDFDYPCKETDDDYFIGFSVWRKINPNPFVPDSCETGLDGRSYEIVKFLTTENDGINYFFIDTNNLEKGRIYCYRVLANFALRTPSGNPYNITESKASNEICLQLSQDIPLITHVSVLETDIQNGEIYVEWIKPLANDLDTIENPGPYRYVLNRSLDGINYTEVPGATFTTEFFTTPIDLNFTDINLNTAQQQYHYKIDFYSSGQFYESSLPASSIFLNIFSSDRQNRLIWSEEVPWENFSYDVYRDSGSGFEFLASTKMDNFLDTGLQNEIEYCYYIESSGTYGLSTTPPLLQNLSQQNCGTPIDTVGPCAPILSVDNPCDLIDENFSPAQLVNTLSWNDIEVDCPNSGDLDHYNIYYTNNVNAEPELIASIDAEDVAEFEHVPEEGINGCYAITGVDSLGNEGPSSNLVCVENCPIYTLPNSFTPNGDGANDRFVPIENRFVHSIDIKILNRWGNVVFETADPEILWDGRDLSGNEVDEGTYYYKCIVFEQNNDGLVRQSKLLTGYIELFR